MGVPLMKALVTGSAGFVGRHMIDHLDRTGWHTAGIDIADSGTDAVDYFRDPRPHPARWDLVVHAAASAPHRAAIDGEPQHMARNLMLDAALFDWAVRTGQGRVIYLSSSAAYPVQMQTHDALNDALHEDDIDLDDAEEPDSVYGWTKLTGERMAAEARKAGLAVTVVRPFSGYGEDQSPNFPFRAILDRVKRRKDPLTIWGDGTQVRDWIHIDDVVAGVMAVAESGTEEPVNLCTGVGTSMRELGRLACEQAGYDPWVHVLTDRPAGVAYRVGDPIRLHRYFTPKVSLAEGVERALRAA
jgi:nucleoside-diphosphate-sugar epimerase